MKLTNFALIFALVLLLVVATPARTQTINIAQLPTELNIALCMNNWDKALNLLQPLISSDTISAQSHQQLVALRSKIEDYRAKRAQVDQSDACAAAIATTGPNRNVSTNNVTSNRGSSGASTNCAADGKCFANLAAKKRHNRSWAEGDRPSPQAVQH